MFFAFYYMTILCALLFPLVTAHPFVYTWTYCKCLRVLTKPNSSTSHNVTVYSPIIEYGSEIWSLCSSYDSLETLHLRFLKWTLGVRPKTPIVAVLGDLGRYPLRIKLQIKAVKLWCKLVIKPNRSFPKLAYNILFRLRDFGFLTWLDHIHTLLKEVYSHNILIQLGLQHMKSSASHVRLRPNCINNSHMNGKEKCLNFQN